MRKLLIIMACVALGGCATFSEPKFQSFKSEPIAKHRVKPTKHVSPVVLPAQPSPPAATTKPKRKHWWHKLPRWL